MIIIPNTFTAGWYRLFFIVGYTVLVRSGDGGGQEVVHIPTGRLSELLFRGIG